MKSEASWLCYHQTVGMLTIMIGIRYEYFVQQTSLFIFETSHSFSCLSWSFMITAVFAGKKIYCISCRFMLFQEDFLTFLLFLVLMIGKALTLSIFSCTFPFLLRHFMTETRFLRHLTLSLSLSL